MDQPTEPGPRGGRAAEPDTARAHTRSELAERALRQQREFLQVLIDLIPDFVFIRDRESRFTLVNDSLCEGIGRQRAELLGVTPAAIFPAEIAAAQVANDREVFAGGELSRIEERLVAADGDPIMVETIRVPYRATDGRVVGVLGICRDVTDRLEEQREHERTFRKLQNAFELIQRQEVELRKANEQLHTLSHTDELTGLANRRHFDELLYREWQRALRHQDWLTVLMIDIDQFKAYNDEYGHQMGDETLHEVAQALRTAARRGADVVARYGGEEFIVLVTETDAEAARLVAEETRQAVEDLKLTHEKSGVSDYVTVSIGYASTVPTTASSAEELIGNADCHLYAAKRAGRNRVTGSAS